MGDNALFFYGKTQIPPSTLMAPQILHRVIHGQADPEPWQKAMLSFQPAILHGYRRHRVRGVSYPGIVRVANTDAKTGSQSSVLGILVTGLTDGDIYRLDKFEGSEYTHRKVTVRTLPMGKGDEVQPGKTKVTSNNGDEEHLKEALNAASAGNTSSSGGEEVEATTYEWIAGMDRLEETEWDFETFKKENLAWWVGADESEW
ncbi:uncharacterized protein N7511_000183 [Penicillium nucicola]|uniref:uncharacterized protein n=1 Tax=Penicillium nucicola TaxID=1850975 RepID=UPI0025459B56|nr:uncharacterized protein N7511_000183 [Penicillium nucicola]KAJ5775172.1 hypothetical protein N7511_000183 [Penicillium nucicola]